MLEFREVTEAAISDLCAEMRERDQLEVWAVYNRDPAEIVPSSIRQSRVRTAVYDDDGLVCIFGVYVPEVALGNMAAPWLLATDRITNHRATLMRQTRRFLRDMLGYYDRLENVVWAGHDEAIAFIEALGFRLSARHKTLYGTEYHRFWKDAPHV